MKNSPARRWLLAVLFATCTGPAGATTITLSSAQIGTYSSLGYRDPTAVPPTAFVGGSEAYISPSIATYLSSRGFLSFDVSSLAGNVAGATLRLSVTGYQSVGPYVDPNNPFPIGTQTHATESFGLFDVSTGVSDLWAAHPATIVFPGGPQPNPAGQVVFNDLGSGVNYGNFLASAALVGNTVDIALSSLAIADINAHGGIFSLGLLFNGPAFSGIGGQLGAPLVDQHILLNTNLASQQLILTTVPLPAAVWLLASGLLVWLPLLRARGARNK